MADPTVTVLQDDRVQKLQRLAKLQESVKVLKTNIQHLADNDPEILEQLGTVDMQQSLLALNALLLPVLTVCHWNNFWLL